MSLLNIIENVVKTNVSNQIDLLTSLFGIKCKVYNQSQDIYASVYGSSNATQQGTTAAFETELLIIGDTSTPYDIVSVGLLQEAWLYTNDARINVGQIIETVRDDGTLRKYKIERAETLGSTDKVFFKFRLSAIGAE